MGALMSLFRARPGLGALAAATDWTPLAIEVGERHGVDPALVISVIAAESGGHPGAINPSDPSYGLMQVTPATASWLLGRPISPDDLLDPALNVDVGTRYLAYQLARYRGDVALAVNAYRAGTASDTPRSQSYVTRVFDFLDRLAGPAVAEAAAAPSASGPAAGLPPWATEAWETARRYWWVGAGALLVVLVWRR
jgi:soluble lytic murein transglycosylase-like protein